MKKILEYYIRSLKSNTKSLKMKLIFIEKPWALVDNDKEVQKLIFEKDGSLTLSKNGVVTEGSWKYYPEARAIKINRGKDILLLSEQFIDENVIILKKDGTGGDFFALSNENTIPDYDIPKYLHSLRNIQLKIKEVPLIDGNYLEIIGGSSHIDGGFYLNGMTINLRNKDGSFDQLESGQLISKSKENTYYIENGKITRITNNIEFEAIDFGNVLLEIDGPKSIKYISTSSSRVTCNGNPILESRIMSKNRVYTFYLKDGFVRRVVKNLVCNSTDNNSFEIEDGSDPRSEDNYNKTITINGKIISDQRIQVTNDLVYDVKNSKIVKILIIRDYQLSNGYLIRVEQSNQNRISTGDKVVYSEPQSPIPNGTYRIKRRLKSITIWNGIII